jgi:organic hydroperoxide reductase OsmC/OhrA
VFERDAAGRVRDSAQGGPDGLVFRAVRLPWPRTGSDRDMSEHTAVVEWEREGAMFTDNRYSRAHRWRFDGGVEVPASSSPHVVPLPLSVSAAVDPEEALVASLSSCHMLWFLSIAAGRGFLIESYRDHAVGRLGNDASGKLAMTRVTLRPEVEFGGERRPSADEVTEMHHESHERCFIANSVKTAVVCEPVALPA